MVVVLPEPLTPTTRMMKGVLLSSTTSGFGDRRQHALDFAREDFAHFLGLDVALVARLADRLGDARRGAHAKISPQQHVFELLERQRVELALGENVGDALGDRLRGAREAAGQARPPGALFLLRRLLLRRRLGRRFGRGLALAAAKQAGEHAALFAFGFLAHSRDGLHELRRKGQRAKPPAARVAPMNEMPAKMAALATPPEHPV